MWVGEDCCKKSRSALLHRAAVSINMRPALAGSGIAREAQAMAVGTLGGVANSMNKPARHPSSPLRSVNSYLEKNFPDFFAEARFQVGDDDYFLYARFGQYLARTIEAERASREKINRGFTVLNKMARASARNPRIRQMLVSGPLEYIVDAPKARALARKRLSPVAQGYLESLCE